MIVPIHKRWEASFARLQVVQRDSVVQLVAFFKDFQFGTCMNFVLKNTDKFEAISRSDKPALRMVDAKFPLPKRLPHDSSAFISLDMPDYPSERDDITIGFESEQGTLLKSALLIRTDHAAERDRFGSALPAEVVKPSRLGSLRR